jgi:tetratricopeptide (TPR) repeat protein
MTEELVPETDPETLEDVYPDAELVATTIAALRAEIVAAEDEIDELRARGELVTLLRAVGDLDEARDEAQRATDRAEIAGNAAQQHTARVRLARVRQAGGDFAQSNLDYTELLAPAARFGPVIEAFTVQNAGLNDFAQGHWADAAQHFARALKLRDELELDEAERAASRVALAAARRHVDEEQQ